MARRNCRCSAVRGVPRICTHKAPGRGGGRGVAGSGEMRARSGSSCSCSRRWRRCWRQTAAAWARRCRAPAASLAFEWKMDPGRASRCTRAGSDGAHLHPGRSMRSPRPSPEVVELVCTLPAQELILDGGGHCLGCARGRCRFRSRCAASGAEAAGGGAARAAAAAGHSSLIAWRSERRSIVERLDPRALRRPGCKAVPAAAAQDARDVTASAEAAAAFYEARSRPAMRVDG